jgi:hypothetical protein
MLVVSRSRLNLTNLRYNRYPSDLCIVTLFSVETQAWRCGIPEGIHVYIYARGMHIVRPTEMIMYMCIYGCAQ